MTLYKQNGYDHIQQHYNTTHVQSYVTIYKVTAPVAMTVPVVDTLNFEHEYNKSLKVTQRFTSYAGLLLELDSVQALTYRNFKQSTPERSQFTTLPFNDTYCSSDFITYILGKSYTVELPFNERFCETLILQKNGIRIMFK